MRLRTFDSDTIAAISTPMGEGGIGVIRLSGKDAFMIADKLFRSKSGTPVSRQKNFTAQYGHIVSGQSVIDEVLVLAMRAPATYTRENVVEISAHGGAATLGAVLKLVLACGAREAERGEFTKRAFLNGRIDLLQAEAVLDLIGARTELAQRWAASQLEGSLSEKVRTIKNELVDVLSHLEASVDFPDDSPDTDSDTEAASRLRTVAGTIEGLLKSSELGLIVKKGLRIVIAGRPNVGKSSLMNRLTRQNRVIVTPIPGTTRDTVEEDSQLSGFPIRLVDTAGIQETEHAIEREGIERSKLAVSSADLVLYVADGSRPLTAEDLELIEALEPTKTLIVLNKSDLTIRADMAALKRFNTRAVITASCVTDGGTDALENGILQLLTGGRLAPSNEPVISTVRQKESLERTLEAITRARQAAEEGLSPELIAVDVRLALDHLGTLVGEVVTDEVLDRLFARFCIGK